MENKKRCFSYIDDVIFYLEKLALDESINKEIINIGPDEETVTLNELAKLVNNEIRFNGESVHVRALGQRKLKKHHVHQIKQESY
jgi:UDP-glucose 4-epimerase